ncbi:COMM domain-containing protein 3 [Diprion similis]|uniref:COMM domain-containing protein 3 n=1 Tax=Diprion similis TaxID=362088 RepID=UPI001EF841AC|nr:COMM domain-containing protein 3 [Diprion similis]
MELSESTIKGLSSLQNPKIINDVIFGNLIDIAVLQLCEKSEDKYVAQLYGSKPDVVKEIFGNLSSLLIDAARLDLDGEKLNLALSNVNITGPRVKKLCDAYVSNKEGIQASLIRIGNSLPHVVDVNWKLDYCVKSNIEDSIGSQLYTIQFSTINQGKPEFMKFACTTQQLQELVYKLKDAVRHVEKVANV